MPIATPQGTLDFKSVDKVTFVGASSNTVIDTTTGSLGVGVGVGGPTSNLHVVGNAFVSSNLTVSGNAFVSSNLTVSGNVEVSAVTQVQEYPPRSLHQYITHVEGHGVFNVLASAEYNQTADNDRAWKMFTKIADADNYWTPASDGYDASNGNATSASPSTNGTAGHWVQLELPYKVKLHSVKIASSANHADRRAKDATVFGSNDGGSTWTNVGGWTNNNVSDFSLVTFSMNNVGYYNLYRLVVTKNGGNATITLTELQFLGTPSPTTLDKDSLSLSRSLDAPRVSRYDVDTETPRPEKLVVDYDTTVNSSPTDISGRGSHGIFAGDASYSVADKAFKFTGASTSDRIDASMPTSSGDNTFSVSFWYKRTSTSGTHCPFIIGDPSQGQSIAMDIYSAGTVYWFIYSGKNFSWTGVTDTWFPVNTWTHVVCIHTAGTDFANLNEVYINGVPQSGTATFGGANDLSLDAGYDALVLGCRSSGTNHAIGHISNFKVYSVTLEPSEVRKLYNLGRTGRSMIISDTAVGIGKAPEAQLDVRGVLKASVGLFPDRPSFMCPVAIFGAKAIPTSTTMYDYSTRDGLTLSNRTPGNSTMRWKLGDNGGRHTNTMYPTNNVKLVRVLDDTTSETSGVQVPYEGYYLCHNFVRSASGGYNMGNSFITYSESQQKYITASINGYMVPWGGSIGASGDYAMQFISAVLYLRPNDKVIFSFWNQTGYSGGYEQYVSLVML